jgi:hypothetical protein
MALAFWLTNTPLAFPLYTMSEQPVENNTEHTQAGPKPFRSQFAMNFDNLEEELSKVPLFMTDLPTEENDTLNALQSLVFDGTPEGIFLYRAPMEL